MISYLDLVNSFENNPRNINTKPIISINGKWFYVYVEKNNG